MRRFTPEERFWLHIIIGAGITVLCMWLFFGVAIDLAEKDPAFRADTRIMELLKLHRTPLLTAVMLFSTTLGDSMVIGVGMVCAGFFLALRRQWRRLTALFISVGIGSLFINILKLLVKRPRPPLDEALVSVQTFSFPSGHSFIAFSFYALLLSFLIMDVRNRTAKVTVTAFGGVLILMIGLSRIYLGAHWPSDVLAGYATGAVWLAAHIAALRTYPDPPRFPVSGRNFPAIAAILTMIWVVFVLHAYRHHLSETESRSAARIITVSRSFFAGHARAAADRAIEQRVIDSPDPPAGRLAEK